MTDGFDVFVHEVIAAMTTEPSVTAAAVATPPPPDDDAADASWRPFGSSAGSALRNDSGTRPSGTRSCGRRGPASDGSIVARSRARVSVYSGSGESSVRN